MELVLLVVAPLLLSFVGQLVVLRCTKRRWKPLRLGLLAVSAVLFFLAWDNARTPAMFGGLHDLATLAYALWGAETLLGWGGAWGVFRWREGRKK